MAFKVDPDAAPLYKDIKKMHAALNKAVKQQPVEHVLRALMSVFGSTSYRCTMTDKNSNDYEDVNWSGPILARSIGAVFNASITVHLDDDSNATGVDMQDQWLYGALLPLGLKIELHDSWKEVLQCVTERISGPTQPHFELFHTWDEKTLVENLGWVPDEDDFSKVDPVNEHQAETARCVVKALHTDPDLSGLAWPAVAPWLHAMQMLSPPPEDSASLESLGNRTVDWEPWASSLKRMYLTSNTQTIVLPAEFSEPSPTGPGTEI